MDAPTVSHAELGRHLIRVREAAGLKQAELARKITWSPAVLSRIESGDRNLEPGELETILDAIGTPEATKVNELLGRQWDIIPRPPLDHPDHDLLWESESVAKELKALQEQPHVRSSFERRISEYVSQLQHGAAQLLRRDHQIAFIGSIGVGKSTAICRLTGLEVADAKGGQPHPVLEAGAGGITICEVQLHTGPGYGIRIEPRGDEEIRGDVGDFAEHLMARDRSSEADASEDQDSQGISKEIERALRNMSGLTIRRDKVGGRTQRRDEAKDLAGRVSNQRELVVEILARMELHRRDRRDVWYDASVGMPQLAWLKETFEQVNNGRHPEFTLPKRIEVVVPVDLLNAPGLSVRIIDTRGIDRTAARADLEGYLDDAHTLAVLCSGFNNAPAAESRLLLERARDAGVRHLGVRTSLLVFPRTGEPLAVKDESGVKVESAEEGYELKGEQVGLALEPLRLQKFGVGFYNAHQDSPERLRAFLVERLNHVRTAFRDRLTETTANARALLANHEQEQVQEVIRHAGAMIRAWVGEHSAVKALGAHVQDSLMSQIEGAYASTIRASVRREGEWVNLSYSHHLGYGARRIAAESLSRWVDGFQDLCKTMTANPELVEARDLISQAQSVLADAFENLLRKIQLMGQTSFGDALRADPAFWQHCIEEWGQGPGYRNRVADHNNTWFSARARQELEDELRGLIQREWAAAIARVSSLLDPVS